MLGKLRQVTEILKFIVLCNCNLALHKQLSLCSLYKRIVPL
uniref:Uncharacterized protein n=1 Tax=Triticum urartu TaxID=4572 RepID=A0A8R7PBQ1_TRIUA